MPAENYRRRIRVNGELKKYSHYIWHKNTGHWPISPDEVVHHIDGDRTNDAFSNLRLMSFSEHMSLHNSGKNSPMYGKKGKDNPNFGSTRTEETKTKMSMTAIERWKNSEYRDKMSGENHYRYGRFGENSPSWKGDAATPHSKYIRIWRARRRAIHSSSVGRKQQTGAALPLSPPSCDSGSRQHQPMARRGVSLPSVNGPRSSEPTLRSSKDDRSQTK